MKFLIKSLGWDRWRDEVLQTFEAIRGNGGASLEGAPERRLSFDPDAPVIEEAPGASRLPLPSIDSLKAIASSTAVKGPGITPSFDALPSDDRAYQAWASTNVRPQRQPGYSVVIVRLLLGDVTAGQLRVLARLAEVFGDGAIRLTPDQNLFLRWVPDALVPSLFESLAATGLSRAGASTITDVTSCPGAESCKLAVTQSRGLGLELATALAERPEIARGAERAVIKISGCPNGCGQHHIATIGFQGSVRKLDGRAVPQYFVMVGGRSSTDGAAFARLAAKVPARRVTTAVERLLDLYRKEREGEESPEAYFARVPVPRIKLLLADLEAMTAASAAPEDYVDLAETHAFVPEVMEGECAS